MIDKINYKSKIENITQTGECDMFEAELSIGNHATAVKVIGKDIDECILRAVIIREAFNEIDMKASKLIG